MKKILCCLLTVILLVVLAGCSGGLTDEDFNVYDGNGSLVEEFQTKKTGDFVLGYRFFDEQEITKRGIGQSSSEADMKKQYSDADENLFKVREYSNPKSVAYYYKLDDKIMSFACEGGDVVGVAVRSKDYYQMTEFTNIWSLIFLGRDEELETEGYDSFLNMLSEEEKELGSILTDHCDVYSDGILSVEDIADPTTATWLTGAQQKMVGDMYQKFVENYDFGY